MVSVAVSCMGETKSFSLKAQRQTASTTVTRSLTKAFCPTSEQDVAMDAAAERHTFPYGRKHSITFKHPL